MANDLLRKRDAAMAARTPPDWCRGHGFEKQFSIKRDECTPDAESDAALIKTLKLIIAGERLAEVVRRLRAISVHLELDAEATRQRADMVLELIEYAEADDA